MISRTLGPDVSSQDHLVYIYAIVPAEVTDPPPDLAGLDDTPVRVLRVGAIAAVVSDVARELYDSEALDARLDDLAWVGERGLAHERVVDWYAERSPVIPLSLFSLHESDARAESRVREGAAEYGEVLERLRGRTEWGIRLWRREADAREAIDRHSASLRALAAELDEAPPGRRFLLERKRESMRVEEMRAASKRIAHDTYDALQQVAEGAVAVPLPGNPPAGERALLLHAAFLVPDDGFATFQTRVTELAHSLAETGFELEFTGPWPPYHFSSPDDE